ncbi:hypothetical protein MMC30_007472 [Trapelia coarctata]|nr:hypothetical protein [Trapelia coarctata]
MSTNSPEPESRIPKPSRTSIANRDKPLFAGRRPPSHLQQRPDFFTDSLNTSYAPSPSPARKPARPSAGANARSTPVNGKQPATAFRATPDGKNGNKSPLSGPSTNSRRQPPQSRRSPTVQTSEQGSPSPAPLKPLPSRSATRTPSPARGRPQIDALSPTSEASASSPPRGLAEAYQRIEDEEYLASREDDSVDDPSYMDGSRSEKAGYIHQDHQQEPWGHGSPPSHKSSGRMSLREAFKEVTERGERHMSYETRPQSSDEDSTNFLPPNPEQDTFDRVLSQYDKDEQRLRGALGSDVQPFKKSRTRDRTGLTIENLHRKDASSRSGSSTRGSPSISSKGSDPSFNIPQGWGRKGRGNNTWLSRISQENGKFTGDKSNLRALSTAAQDGKESSSQVVDWIAAAAEVPLPSVENDSLQTDSTSRRSTPASHLKRQAPSASSDRIRRWEFLDDDFTARSLQISDSPPIRIRNGALDAIREREIESLEKSAVTTNRLGELKEKKSLERVRRRSPSLTAEAIVGETLAEAERESGRRASSRASLHPPPETEEAEAHQNQPLVLEKSPESRPDRHDSDKPSTLTQEAKPDLALSSGRPSQRPSPERHDSRDLLRKLARATSASPGPGPSPTGPERDVGSQANARDATNEEVKKPTVEATHAKVDGSSEQDARKTETSPDIERRPLSSTRALVESTPEPKKPSAYLKTPLVTGAWIDTPLPTGGRGMPMPTPEATEDDEGPSFDDEAVLVKLDSDGVVTESNLIIRPERPPRLPLAETAPLLPKSALSAIIEKAKSNAKRQDHESTEANDDTLLLDDSTIQSLEELLAGENDNKNGNSTLLAPPRSSSPSSPPIPQHKSPERQPPTIPTREQEVQSYNNLTSRLSKVGLSISDAKKGIASLERAVSTAPSKPSSALASGEECTEAGEFHDFIWPCERCGCRGRDDSIEWQSLRVWMPRLWTWRKEDWMPRLTPVGTLSTIVWALLITSWVVDDMYSPPFFAYSMDGYGVDYTAPRAPFVLFKLLWRSPVSAPLQSLWFVVSVLVRLFSEIFGFGAGFFGWVDGKGANGQEAWTYGDAGAPAQSWGDDAAIGSDEYL